MSFLLRFLEQLFCLHGDSIRVTDRKTGRHYTECMSCLKQSPGIHEYKRGDVIRPAL